VSIGAEAGSGSARRLTLAGAQDAADLAAYLSRLIRYDLKAVVRLRARGPVLGVFAQPPFGAIALRGVPLAAPAAGADGLDVTVAAGELLDRLSPGAPSPSVELPASVTGPPWTGLLPPSGGWERLATVPVASLASAVGRGVAEFRSRAEAVAEPERTRARLDALADDVWSRPVLVGLPLRAAHAAHALGFLRGGGEASVHRAAGWLRLEAPYGSVSVRSSAGTGLPLRVVTAAPARPPGSPGSGTPDA
jgi:hypothetical protein